MMFYSFHQAKFYISREKIWKQEKEDLKYLSNSVNLPSTIAGTEPIGFISENPLLEKTNHTPPRNKKKNNNSGNLVTKSQSEGIWQVGNL